MERNKLSIPNVKSYTGNFFQQSSKNHSCRHCCSTNDLGKLSHDSNEHDEGCNKPSLSLENCCNFHSLSRSRTAILVSKATAIPISSLKLFNPSNNTTCAVSISGVALTRNRNEFDYISTGLLKEESSNRKRKESTKSMRLIKETTFSATQDKADSSRKNPRTIPIDFQNHRIYEMVPEKNEVSLYDAVSKKQQSNYNSKSSSFLYDGLVSSNLANSKPLQTTSSDFVKTDINHKDSCNTNTWTKINMNNQKPYSFGDKRKPVFGLRRRRGLVRGSAMRKTQRRKQKRVIHSRARRNSAILAKVC